MPIRRTADGLLYLLIQHRAGHWAFPKGHAEPGEPPLNTATRELLEETGIVCTNIREDTPLTETYNTVKRGQDIFKTVVYFLGWTAMEAVTLQAEEVSAHAWLPFDSALERITHEETRRTLREADRLARLADLG